MAKQWFNYVLSSTSCPPQLTPQNYVAIGAYQLICSLADRTCLIYTFTSSGTAALPSPTPGGAPGISSKIQSYIKAFCGGAGPVVPQPPGATKKYVYVRGT